MRSGKTTKVNNQLKKEASPTVILLGTIIKPWGKVVAVCYKGECRGERFYFCRNHAGVVSLVPADVLEGGGDTFDPI